MRNTARPHHFDAVPLFAGCHSSAYEYYVQFQDDADTLSIPHLQNLAPHYDKFATAVRGKVKVGAVDCTQQQQTCQEFGVRISVADTAWRLRARSSCTTLRSFASLRGSLICMDGTGARVPDGQVVWGKQE